jgi:hypothetical protein
MEKMEKGVEIFLTFEGRIYGTKIPYINIALKHIFIDKQVLRALKVYWDSGLRVFRKRAGPYSYNEELDQVIKILQSANVNIIKIER